MFWVIFQITVLTIVFSLRILFLVADNSHMRFWQTAVQLTPTSRQVCKEKVPLQRSSVVFKQWSINTTQPHIVCQDIFGAMRLNYTIMIYGDFSMGMLTTFPQCNLSMEFPEIFSLNVLCYH